MAKKSALIVMDMQNGIINGLEEKEKEAVIKGNQQAIADARTNQIPVIFVRVAFTGNYLEVSENNKMFSQFKSSGQPMDKSDANTQIIDALQIESTDPIVVKHRLSAFTGSNLEVLLRGMNIGHIVLTGVSTSGVVLSTAVEAADKDYKITILADAVTDNDQQKHKFLLEHILTRYAAIDTTVDWFSKL